MRISRTPPRTVVGLLSLSAQASAVALSDFTPKATNLPPQCNAIYSAAIPGCTFDDFQKAMCSQACLAGLVQVNAQVANNCQAADVEETSIIGLFKLGKAIQLLCNVAVVTTTTGLRPGTTIPMMPMPMPTTQSIQSPTPATSLLSTAKPTTSASSPNNTGSATPSPSAKESTTLSTTPAVPTPLTSSINSAPPPPTAAATSQAKSTSASKTSTSPAELESIRSGNTNSGGGSPFDNINNSGAVSLINLAQIACGLSTALLLGGYLALV
ncbi:hypothetical protein FKW77_002649 [Venturia effusa]|uniref:Extracellular membrane protein CFEM domain-containing protein n=1 Tax=Venturia effusa TaxID=50376 RepID=A0A517LJU1_9PEZI|nr:hypothetical protein FKW77_002649 [Venturia effusa]